MSKHVHHINDEGTAAVCTATDNARCRMRPRCDAEAWIDEACFDHGGAHRVLPSTDCWMVGSVNGTDLTETYEDWQDPPTIVPGAAIDIEFVGPDEGCSWVYAPVAVPANQEQP